jgi:hypothetical protein
MADEEKLQPAADDSDASKQQPAEARPAVDPSVRIGELVEEFEKAKLPFKKVEGLMPQVKTASGETMVGLSVFNPAKKDARHKFLTRPQFEESRKLMSQRLKLWHKMLLSSEDAEDLRNTSVLEAQALEENIASNMATIYEEIRPLEMSYRNIQQFFANSSPSGDPVNAYFSNVSMEELIDPDGDKSRLGRSA